MPIIRNLPLDIRAGQVLRRLGLGAKGQLKPAVQEQLQNLLQMVKEENLISSASAYEIYPIARIGKDEVFLSEEVSFHSRLLATTILKAKQIAVVTCTIGRQLEEKAAACFKSREEMKGFLLDGIGSTAIDMLSAETCYLIGQEAAKSGDQVSSPISPGMPGMLPLSDQQLIFELVPADEIGIQLLPSRAIIPAKSVSMLLGIGPQVTRLTPAQVCARCGLKQSCTHKIRPGV